jgi:hypothetical protein
MTLDDFKSLTVDEIYRDGYTLTIAFESGEYIEIDLPNNMGEQVSLGVIETLPTKIRKGVIGV